MSTYLQVVEEDKRSKLILRNGQKGKTLLISLNFEYLIEVKHALESGLESGEIIFTIINEDLCDVPGMSFPMWYGRIGQTKVFASNISERCIRLLISKLSVKLIDVCRVKIQGDIK